MGWGHGFWAGGWCFFGLLWFLLLAFLVVRLVAFRRFGCWGPGSGWGGRSGRWDAESLVRRRLAGGEIDEAEYQRLLGILRRTP